jgi:hypothetical protein
MFFFLLIFSDAPAVRQGKILISRAIEAADFRKLQIIIGSQYGI